MILEFSKLPKEEFDVHVEDDGLCLDLHVQKKSNTLALCTGELRGILNHQCDICGEPLQIALDEVVEIYASDKEATMDNDELLNIVEFFEGKIDFKEMLHGEVEAIKSDYFYCEKCQN